MKALLVTREYPPHIYGGAGVVADQLSRALAKRMSVEVRCFGDREARRDSIVLRGYTPWERVKAGKDGPRFAPAPMLRELRASHHSLSEFAVAGATTNRPREAPWRTASHQENK